MGDVVNLNRYRKQRQRIEDAKQATENRVRFGRDKAERTRNKAEQERETRNLDNSHLDDKRRD
jgi:vacuolar-type H+-ATPase subunit H